MRTIIGLAIICSIFAGCATKQKATARYTAPTAAAVTGAVAESKQAIAKATSKAAEIKQVIPAASLPLWAELTKQLEESNAKLSQAETAFADYEAKVNTLTFALNEAIYARDKALEREEYWHSKQIKALREIWVWRGIATAMVGSVLTYVGLRIAGKSLA